MTPGSEPPADASNVSPSDADPNAPDADTEAGPPDADTEAGPPDAEAGPPLTVRINVNGPAHTGSDFPGMWDPDPGAGGVCDGSQSGPGSGNIQGTVDDELFRDSVRNVTKLSCDIPGLPSGTYTVNMLFAETFYGTNCSGGGGVGSRLFDIQVEGTLTHSDVDIFQLGNGCVLDTSTPNSQPVVLTANATLPSGGTLDIEMTTKSGSAFIAAIEVIQQ